MCIAENDNSCTEWLVPTNSTFTRWSEYNIKHGKKGEKKIYKYSGVMYTAVEGGPVQSAIMDNIIH